MADPNVLSSLAISFACSFVGTGTCPPGAALPDDCAEDDESVACAFGDSLLAAIAGRAKKKSAKAAVVDFGNCMLATLCYLCKPDNDRKVVCRGFRMLESYCNGRDC